MPRIVTLTEDNSCLFCNNALGKYSCPKCNRLYCSLTCYQSNPHLECSEAFYKQMVEEHIASTSGSDPQARMQEILKRFHEQNEINQDVAQEEELDSDDDEDEDDGIQDLGTRLTGINLDDSEAVWTTLTAEERSDFERFLQSGDVAQFITPWEPWWLFRSSGVFTNEELADCRKRCPTVVEGIKKFKEISTKQPASCVENNLVNVLSAYVMLMRYFNGEAHEFHKEFATYLWRVSLNLSENCNFDTPALAMESIKMQCLKCEELALSTDKDNFEPIKNDVGSLLAGPHASERKFYILSALSDIKTIVQSTKQEEPKEKGKFYETFTATQAKAVDGFTKDHRKSALRKIDYYLAFVTDLY